MFHLTQVLSGIFGLDNYSICPCTCTFQAPELLITDDKLATVPVLHLWGSPFFGCETRDLSNGAS